MLRISRSCCSSDILSDSCKYTHRSLAKYLTLLIRAKNKTPPCNRTRLYTRYTTCYNRTFPHIILTEIIRSSFNGEEPAQPTGNVFRSVGSSEVIFLYFLLAPGSHHPRFALSFGKIILSSSTPLQVKYTMNAHLSRVLVYFIWRNPGKEKVFLCLIPLPLIFIWCIFDITIRKRGKFPWRNKI